MLIYCRHCGAEIEEKNLNYETLIAKCDKCHTFFYFDEQKVKTPTSDFYRGIHIEEGKGYLLIERQWSKETGRALVFPAIFFIAPVLLILILPPYENFRQNLSIGGTPLAMGLIFAYLACANFLNTTKIHVDNISLRLSHSPLYFPTRQYAVDEIQQLYVKEHFGKRIKYILWMSLNNNHEELLLREFTAAHDALDIEAAIENFLGIEDRQIEGEYR